jgi:hypothetical protein
LLYLAQYSKKEYTYSIMQGLTDSLIKFSVSSKTKSQTLGTATSVGGLAATACFSVPDPICLVYTDPDGKFAIPWPLVIAIVKEFVLPAIGAYLTVRAINETAEYAASIASKPSVAAAAQAPAISDSDKDKIAEHSWEAGHGGEHDLDIPTAEGIREAIDHVLNNPNTVVKEGKDKATGKPKYGYFSPDGTVVIHNPAAPDKGTIYKPDNTAETFENF